MKRSGVIFMGSTGLRLSVKRAASALAILTLAACGGSEGVKQAEEQGIYDDRFQLANLSSILRSAPDEFSVVTKRPLELPGNFDTLPVPEPGKVSSRDPNPQADARAALLSQPASPVPASLAPSTTETAILSSVAPADPAIRQTLAAEQAEYNDNQEVYLLDRIFPSLREARDDSNREQLDGNAERLRLLESGASAPTATGIATIPAAPASGVPVATTPILADPVPVALAPPVQGGPTLAAPEPRPIASPQTSTPTFGVLTPSATDAPDLIYIPE